MSPATAARPAPVLATDPVLLERVLRPYKAHCKYLESAAISAHSGQVTATCELAIPESCYIDDTGHLNAVEVNIGYNQMMYYAVALAVRERLLPAFASWTLQDFWRHQLPDILITRFSGSFRRPIDARAFSGEFTLESARRRAPAGSDPLIFATTSYRYWDERGGRCDGEATLAFIEAADTSNAATDPGASGAGHA